MASERSLRAIAVYCGWSFGNEQAFHAAGVSVGRMLAVQQRPLVYGGGSHGIMGLVSGAVLEGGGHVTGVTPSAMLAAGGEGHGTAPIADKDEHGAPAVVEGRERVETIVVGSMHERKVEMARRACGFIGLPGGFGTFEEIFEAITWTQLGIHNKPVVLINALGFFEPVRALIRGSIKQGFIPAANENILLFVDGPADPAEHATFDWGSAALALIEGWKGTPAGYYDWAQPAKDGQDGLALS